MRPGRFPRSGRSRTWGLTSRSQGGLLTGMTTTRELPALLAFGWDADYLLELANTHPVLARRVPPSRRVEWTCNGGRLSAAKETLLGQLHNLGYLDVPSIAMREFHARVRLTESGAELLARWHAHPAYDAARLRHFGVRVD